MIHHTILVYPDLAYSELQRPAPPYSILFIADALQKAGITVDLFDLRHDSKDAVLSAIQSYNPKFVGLSVMTGPQIKNALDLGKIIRHEAPETQLVWGGIHPTILPLQTLQHTRVDIVIQGDGERPYTQLVQGIDWSRIPGLAFKHNNQVYNTGMAPPTEMSEVRTPWELIEGGRYVERGRTSIITSRGCPYRCTFCYNAIIQSPWRGWTVKQCQHELDQLIGFGAEDILFFDDAFFSNLSRAHQLFPYFRREGLTWIAELRVDRLTQNLARDAKNAGCNGFFFGAESGSPRLLRLLNKGITVKQLLRSAQITHTAQLGADYSWMVGIPTEIEEERRMTLTVIKAIQHQNPNAEFSIKIYTPYPGTPLFDLALEQGAQMPQSLEGWSTLSRFRAPHYLHHGRQLETLSITSSLIGRQMFIQSQGTPLSLLRSLARLRWRNEYFGFPWESLVYGLIFRASSRSQRGRLAQLSQGIAKAISPSSQEETFSR